MKKIIVHHLFFYAVLIAGITATSCSFYTTEGDYFFIERAGAVMPVWVRGNTASGTFIIVNHGGPGQTASYLPKFKVFGELEKEYALVYWDQRCSGISQGNTSPESFTVEDFAADQDLLVDVILRMYVPESVFLYGTSWGGTLATAYCTSPVRQGKIKGYIEEGGGHNMPLLISLSSDIISKYAEAQAAAGVDSDYWTRAVSFFVEHPDSGEWGAAEFYRYAEYLGKAKPYEYTTARYPDEFSGPGTEDIFLSPISFALFFNPGKLIPNFNILSLNLNDAMADITLPVLLLWGEYDINSPKDLAGNAVRHLGTPAEDIYKIIIPNSGHNTMIDQPELFLKFVTAFVEKYG